MPKKYSLTLEGYHSNHLSTHGRCVDNIHIYKDKNIWAFVLHHSNGYHSYRMHMIRIIDWMDGRT